MVFDGYVEIDMQKLQEGDTMDSLIASEIQSAADKLGADRTPRRPMTPENRRQPMQTREDPDHATVL